MFVGSSVPALIAMALSLAAVALSILSVVLCSRRARTMLIKAGSSAKRSQRRRVKRYVLVKVVCFDADAESFVKELTRSVYRALGPVLSARCGLALAAFRNDLGRAILRVSGEADCVRYVLAALSTLHILFDARCIAIPLRVSGCLTRLRKALRVYRAG